MSVRSLAAKLAALSLIGAQAAYAYSMDPPVLTNPQVITVNSSTTIDRIVLAAGKDYILAIGPSTSGEVTINELKVVGGNNVVIVGGHVIRAPNTPTNDPTTGEPITTNGEATINFVGQTGTVYIDGLLVDNGNNFGVDGLDPGGGDVCGSPCQSNSFIFKNIRIENVYGADITINGIKQNHADGLQMQAPITQFLANRMTISSAYQGLNLQPKFALGYAGLSHVNLRYPDPVEADGYANGYALWLGDGVTDTQPAVFSFYDVIVEWRQDQYNTPWIVNSIAADSNMPCGAQYVSGTTNEAYWPAWSYSGQSSSGYVTQYVEGSADYVTEADIINTSTGAVTYTTVWSTTAWATYVAGQ